MIPRSEMYRLADLLDKEYAEEIRPLLNSASDAVEKLLEPITSEDFNNMCERNNFSPLKYGEIPVDAWCCLHGLRFRHYQGNIRLPDSLPTVPDNLVGWLGYSTICRDFEEGRLRNIFDHADGYHRDLKVLGAITDLKEDFNNIKRCYNSLFVNNGGEVIKQMADACARIYNNVANRDKESDAKLYALFGEKSTTKELEITVTIKGA